MSKRHIAWTGALLIIWLAASVMPGNAASSAAHPTLPAILSGPDPLPAFDGPDRCGSGPRFHDWETNPTIANFSLQNPCLNMAFTNPPRPTDPCNTDIFFSHIQIAPPTK